MTASPTIMVHLLVLAIEDSPTDALLVERELRRGGYDPVIERVETRAALIDALARCRWDIAISDYSLPGWSGIDALAVVRQTCADLPFILVSGTIGEDVAVQAIKTGASDYLLKDRLTRLPAAVGRALAEAELRRDRHRAQASLAFLSESSALLSESLDETAIAETLVTLAVPRLADRATADLVGEGGASRRVAARDATPAEVASVAVAGAAAVAAGAAVGGGTASAGADAAAKQASAAGAPADAERNREGSVLALPLTARGDPLGVLTLAVGPSGRSFSASDAALAEELARRASVAFENARLYREAQEAIAARENFLLLASHELKTPLTPLLLHVRTLTRASSDLTQPPPAAVAKGLESTLRHVQRLTHLVDELLDVSSLDTDRLELVQERLDLAAFVREIAQDFAPQATEAGCPLVVRAEGPLWGRWDRPRIAQVLGNLLSNAFKFGAGKVVDLSAERHGRSARLRVHDGGDGVLPADRTRIFARFERAVSVRRYGGFGLGLWVARRIVEAHGGTIDVGGEPGEGAIFTVELPAE